MTYLWLVLVVLVLIGWVWLGYNGLHWWQPFQQNRYNRQLYADDLRDRWQKHRHFTRDYIMQRDIPLPIGLWALGGAWLNDGFVRLYDVLIRGVAYCLVLAAGWLVISLLDCLGIPTGPGET